MRLQDAQLREIIEEQQSKIEDLTHKLEKSEWVITYLEQRNKQLEDQQEVRELQNIWQTRQAARRRRIEFTSLEQ